LSDRQNRIRLIYYIPCLGTGGTERVVLNLCRHVSKDLFEIEVCSMSDGLIGNAIRALNIPVKIICKAPTGNQTIVGKICNYLKMIARLHSPIVIGRPTVFHTHHYGPLLQMFLVKKFGMKPFGWLHTEHSRTDVHNSYANPFYRMVNPMRGPDIVSGVSEKVTSLMNEVSGIPADRSVTILNGIDTTLYKAENREKKRHELGFTNNDRIIGTIGNLRKEKNQRLLIRAFSLLIRDIPDLYLVICGDGEYRSELESLSNNLGIASRVRFLGFRMDAHEIMSTFDIYCLPSVYEGLPLSILEAWAAHKPVVATDVIGINDIVHHESNGLLVPLDNERKMAEALSTFLRDSALAQRLADNGHTSLLKNYDLNQMIKLYSELYQKIAV
jgi:L-malate glycosyltransferase